MRHLDGRTQSGFSREHGGVDDLYFVIEGVGSTGHEPEGVLAS